MNRDNGNAGVRRSVWFGRVLACCMTWMLVLTSAQAFGLSDVELAPEDAAPQSLHTDTNKGTNKDADRKVERSNAENDGSQEGALAEEPIEPSVGTANPAEDLSETSDMKAESQGEAVEDTGGLVAQAAPNVSLSGEAHVQNLGWIAPTKNDEGGMLFGTFGRSLRLESLKLSISGDKASVGSIECRAHVQNEGWKPWTGEGKTIGTTGKSQRLESMRIRLNGGAGWHVYYRAHVQNIGWMGWAKDGELAGTAGLGLRMECVEIRLVREGEQAPQGGEAFRDEGLSTSAHVQNIGWTNTNSGKNVTLGTTGRGLRVEAFRINRPSSDVSGDVVYQAHVQNIGWQGVVRNGQVAGTTGRSYRVEAVRLSLTGDLAEEYDIWYRTHVGNIGWLAWTNNGESSGTCGMAMRVEAVQIALLPKGSAGPKAQGQASDLPFLDATTSVGCLYSARISDGATIQASDGKTSGTIGQSKPICGIAAEISGMSGSISYSAYVSGKGWTSYASNGEWVGDANVEAVRVTLNGELAKFYDVWYQSHMSDLGWIGWACNGQSSGPTGRGYIMEAWQVVLRPKGFGAPGTVVSNAYGQRRSTINDAQRKLYLAALSTPSPGDGLCALWVEQVYSNAGFRTPTRNANTLYDMFCHSGNTEQLKVGMIVAVSTHSRTLMGSQYGHVGIYIGNGELRDAVYGYVRQISLKQWLAYYGTTVQPRWGWIDNINIA